MAQNGEIFFKMSNVLNLISARDHHIGESARDHHIGESARDHHIGESACDHRIGEIRVLPPQPVC